MRRRTIISRSIASVLALALLVVPALANTPGNPAQMPTQAQMDGSSSDPGASGPGWGDMTGGVAARPYIVALSVINGGVTTPVITGGSTADGSVAPGGLTAVVSPLNLCAAGQAPAPGVCYASPNRVGVTVGYGNGNTDGWDFSNPAVPVSPTIDSNSVIDMTVALNTLGESLRWTWVNGDLLYWRTSNLGRADATVELKFKPATAPFVPTFPPGNGCTATPPTNCEIPTADGQVLSAQVVFSLDNTLDPSLTGAVFATQNALYGYLAPGGTQNSPTLDLELASAHQLADGSPEIGTVQAFIPSSTLLNLYGVLPGDSATAFSLTRLEDPGTNNPPSFTPWTAAANGSDGLLITVDGITFSAPSYQIAGKLTPIVTHATVRGGVTRITATTAKHCIAAHKCIASVYSLGPPSTPRFLTKATMLSSKQLANASAVTVTSATLPRGYRYLLVLRTIRGHKLLASGTGVVG